MHSFITFRQLHFLFYLALLCVFITLTVCFHGKLWRLFNPPAGTIRGFSPTCPFGAKGRLSCLMSMGVALTNLLSSGNQLVGVLFSLACFSLVPHLLQTYHFRLLPAQFFVSRDGLRYQRFANNIQLSGAPSVQLDHLRSCFVLTVLRG